MTKAWILRKVEQPHLVVTMQKMLRNLPFPLARILVLRGIDTFEKAREFFRPALKFLHDPMRMQDMREAVKRVIRAIERRERVVIYGDYDVDGTTATALLMHFLQSQGMEVDFFIPNRFRHGYGLHAEGIDYADHFGASLIIAVDCGITAFDEALYAKAKGIDLIICDHHTSGTIPPEAVAVIDPKRPTCPYPFKELTGCGIAYKLVKAILINMDQPINIAHGYLDLVALSTACDVVPLKGENRILLCKGLQSLRKMHRPGLKALAVELDYRRSKLNNLSTRDLGFTFGPRINAAGRMGSASSVVELLLSTSAEEAAPLAAQLEEANKKRREVDSKIEKEVRLEATRLFAAKMRHALVLHKHDWHPGVLGIVASRIVRCFEKPVIMLCTTHTGEASGSARSIRGINIHSALQACEETPGELFTRFGGHDQAAGLTLPIENIPVLQERLDAVVSAQMTPDMMESTIEVDAELDLETIDNRFMSIIKQLPPHGNSNETPLFVTRNLHVVRARSVGKEDQHLKLGVRHKSGSIVVDVIGFKLGDKFSEMEEARKQEGLIEMVFSVEENTYMGRTSLQLNARDVRTMANHTYGAWERWT